MVQRIGTRRKTRALYTKSVRERGKLSLRKYFQSFNAGDAVRMVGDSAVASAMPWFRLHGRVGKVLGKQGSCYLIDINDRGKAKRIIVHPAHLQRVR